MTLKKFWLFATVSVFSVTCLSAYYSSYAPYDQSYSYGQDYYYPDYQNYSNDYNYNNQYPNYRNQNWNRSYEGRDQRYNSQTRWNYNMNPDYNSSWNYRNNQTADNSDYNRNAMDSRTSDDMVSDSDLHKKVQDTLKGGYFTKGFQNVNFRIQNGKVILDGSVGTLDDKKSLIKKVIDIKGVTDVNADRVIVMPATNSNYRDNSNSNNSPTPAKSNW